MKMVNLFIHCGLELAAANRSIGHFTKNTFRLFDEVGAKHLTNIRLKM